MSPALFAALIAAWFGLHGYPAAQREALVAAAGIESGWLPTIVSGAGDAGLYQWRGARRRALLAYERRRVPVLMRAAEAAGDDRLWSERSDWARLAAQLEFADRELRARPEAARFFAAPDQAAAARVLCREFLRRRGC